MIPIPLTSPDGTVYAYACGVCHHVRSPNEMLVPIEPGYFAESSRQDAERCCICMDCGAHLQGRRGIVCDACWYAIKAEPPQIAEETQPAPVLPDTPQARAISVALERYVDDFDDVIPATLDVLAAIEKER